MSEKIEAEQALKGAVEAVGIMQQQMQTLQAEEKHAAKGAQKILMWPVPVGAIIIRILYYWVSSWLSLLLPSISSWALLTELRASKPCFLWFLGDNSNIFYFFLRP